MEQILQLKKNFGSICEQNDMEKNYTCFIDEYIINRNFNMTGRQYVR